MCCVIVVILSIRGAAASYDAGERPLPLSYRREIAMDALRPRDTPAGVRGAADGSVPAQAGRAPAPGGRPGPGEGLARCPHRRNSGGGAWPDFRPGTRLGRPMVLMPPDTARLTPERVRAVRFRLSRRGRRGLDEDDVEGFCAWVEREIGRLLEERSALYAEVSKL